MNLEQVWRSTLSEMELQISRTNFATWLKKSILVDKKDGVFRIALPNSFAKEWVESKYSKNIMGIIRGFDPSVKKIEFIVTSNLFEDSPSGKANEKSPAGQNQIGFEFNKIDPETNLNPRYNFKSFVVGSSNELAYAAAISIVKEVGTKYNPFFVYGGVGLGKTHLLQAIGNEIKNNLKNVKVKYVSSEKFTNDVIWAIRNKRMDDIKKKYRGVDVLIIDDVQFIGGKAATEEEFFHTFNTLYEANKQIVISSDRPPQSLPILGERLSSRFQGGLVADITFPEYEMRVAIIKNRLLENGQNLEGEIIDLVAQKVKRNVRELEGVLKQIIFYRDSKKIELTKKNVDEIIEKITRDASSKTTPAQILKGVSQYFGISTEELTGQSRKKEYVEPRQIAMYFLREILEMSYPSIGEKLGKRDHTTAIHGCEKINQEINKNAALNQKMFSIKELINKTS